ncbi:type 1 glutamine amidotransferase [Niabella aquatica]
MKVHYLQHVSFEGLGYIETWLKAHDHDITSTRFFEKSYHLPNVEEIEALIVMGGPMGVYDETKFPFLKEEKAFIKNCIREGKKILGICLGAQLLADCLGAKVNKAPYTEIGWFPVTPTAESRQISWFNELFKNTPTVFHWHGDRFEIPEGSINLLSSEANTNQAFYYSKKIIGLQFHLEVTQDTIMLMLKNGVSELQEGSYQQTTTLIQSGAKNTRKCNEIMNNLLHQWLNG